MIITLRAAALNFHYVVIYPNTRIILCKAQIIGLTHFMGINDLHRSLKMKHRSSMQQ